MPCLIQAHTARAPALCIFTRPIVAGKTKTRLAPTYGADGAARLAAAFLLDTYHTAQGLAVGRVIVSLAEPGPLPELRPAPEIWPQGPGDLGERMTRTAERALARDPSYVVIIGSDAGLCLAALNQQDVDEVIVVDGGSSDQTLEVAKSHVSQYRGRLSIVHSERGRAKQLNHGAARAQGDVLWFVHADVELPPDACDWVRRALANRDAVGGAFKTHTVLDAPLTGANVWQRGAARCLRLADLRSRYTRLPYGDQALFVRRLAFEQVAGFPDIPLMEDLELSRRLRTIGRLVRADAEVRVSGHRFIEHPFVDTALVNLFPLLYRVGVPPERLAAWYPNTR